MSATEDLYAKIDRYISLLRLPGSPEKLYAPINYSLEGGGKRLRPVILLLACEMFGGDPDKALSCAAAVEVFHNFTLLHDDIMDNADVRRGKMSVHRKWGRNVAILSGDAMVIYSYRLLGDAPAAALQQVLSEFNRMALEVCEGQQMDIDFEGRENVTLDEYMEMIRLKTAALMAGSAKIGAIIGGADRHQLELIYKFGLELGMAYQLQDDYLDTYGTPEMLGKRIGGDIAESKKTFLMINALQEAGEATRRALLATLRESSLPLEHKLSRVRTIYNSLDVPEMTRAAVDLHINNALAALDEITTGQESKSQFIELIGVLRDRNK